ncbi:uncharacterized protein LOC109846587 [Asparagus officinalis]|uniref:uncharacterized protein LOC109846587 n=1 Tax=Asparagus officinalis TaxID=4686 RepID=UPI00098E1EA1|nr:uncharacterized protein LOC109846587 [Asparagus officinalis]
MTIDISIIGPRGVRKTALIRRFCHLVGAKFPSSKPHRGHLSTRVNFELDEVGVSLNIWDGYSSGLALAKGVLLLFDPLEDKPFGCLRGSDQKNSHREYSCRHFASRY